MTDSIKYKWEGAGTALPDGHTIFETHDGPDGSMWAIADESGGRPDETDDGVLWLDPGRCLCIKKNTTHDSPYEYLSIPLRYEDGTYTRTPTDAATILFLSRFFSWTIEDKDRGAYYNVR